MNPIIRTTADVRLIDLVLDPLIYHHTLIASARQGTLGGEAASHLAEVLPPAIEQLDAIGDEYGALALAGLYEQVARLEPVV